MTDGSTPRRVVILAHSLRGETSSSTCPLRSLFQEQTLQHWHVVEAQGWEHARFLIQLGACEAVIVDESACPSIQESHLGWLTQRPEVPVLYLAGNQPELITHSLSQGAQWLPRQLTLDNPSVLAAALERALHTASLGRRLLTTQTDLTECSHQVTRLVNLLWETLPIEGQPSWFNQRYMMERLHQEVVRTQRHGSPLAIVLGELWVQPQDLPAKTQENPSPSLLRELTHWVAGRILQSKRRSDVAGQYGTQGFIMLLPHTPPQGVSIYCRRLLQVLNNSSDSSSQQPTLNAYLGAASFAMTETPVTLLRQAEENLERAKMSPGPSLALSLPTEN